MTNNVVFKAILAMDSYNRGYGSKLSNLGESVTDKIGNYYISNTKGDLDAQSVGFYSVAYQHNDTGAQVISYRGTDAFFQDMLTGWITGSGVYFNQQAWRGADFYRAVIGEANPMTANVEFVGHSLGGGLAGLMSNLYHRDATVFNNMPFEFAASLVYGQGNSGDATALANYYFNGATPLAPNWIDVEAYATTGETLALSRATQFAAVDYLNSNGGARSPFDLHSQALLVNLLYAREEGLATDWHEVGGDFVNAMFDNTVGVASGSGNADKMLNKIAYSAIDEGERVFGDTAIQAMWSDANDLGKAMAASNVSDELEEYSYELSQAFVQYAGHLADKKVLQADSPEVIAGILNLSPNAKLLSLSLSSSVWSAVGGASTVAANVGINSIVNSVTTPMFDMTAADGSNLIDNIIFVTQKDVASVVTTTPADGKVNVIVGTDVNDTIVGSGGADFMIGYDGNDRLVGDGGNDTLRPGGLGDGIRTGGDSTLDGGDGIDMVDFSFTSEGVTVNLATHTGLIEGLVDDDNYTITNIENVWGSFGSDTLTGDQHNNALYGGGNEDSIIGNAGDDFLSGGNGNDTLTGGGDADIFAFEFESGACLPRSGEAAWGNKRISHPEAKSAWGNPKCHDRPQSPTNDNLLANLKAA